MIQIDLPKPLSVNRTRRINWAAKKDMEKWSDEADKLLMIQGGLRMFPAITGAYEATLIMPEKSRLDLDNPLKGVLDWARRLRLVKDDSPKYLRRVTVQFGEAPEGCRLILEAV